MNTPRSYNIYHFGFFVKYTIFCSVPKIIINWTFDTVAIAAQVGQNVFHSFQHMRFTPRRLRVMFELVFRFFFTPIPGRRRVHKRTLWHIYTYTYKLNWFNVFQFFHYPKKLKLFILFQRNPYATHSFGFTFVSLHSFRFTLHSFHNDTRIPTTTRLYYPEIRFQLCYRNIQTWPHKSSRTHSPSSKKSALGNRKHANWRNNTYYNVLRTMPLLRIMPHELSKNTGIRDESQQRRKNDLV